MIFLNTPTTRQQDFGQNVNIVYGLAGDPPHKGHLDAIKYLLSVPNSRVWVILSASHAFGKKTAPYEKRKEWLSLLLFDDVSGLMSEEKSRVLVSDLEIDILKIKKSKDPVYSADIQRYLSENYPDEVFYWGFGMDNANIESIKKFKDYEMVLKWPILTIPEMKEVRSTRVREALKERSFEFLYEKIGERLTQNIVQWISEKEGLDWLNNRV